MTKSTVFPQRAASIRSALSTKIGPTPSITTEELSLYSWFKFKTDTGERHFVSINRLLRQHFQIMCKHVLVFF